MNTTTDLWLIRAGGQNYGPYTVDQIRGYIQEGRVQAQTEIAAAGSAAWTTVASLPFFAGLFAPGTTPPMPMQPAAVPSYASPSYATPAAVGTGERAGFWPRVGAILIDGIVVSIAQILIGGIVGLVAGEVVGGLLGVVAAIAYFVVLHAAPRQATLGKQLLGLRLMRDDGRPVGHGLALGRYFATMLSGLPFGIGFLLPLFRDDRKTLHDMVCGTHVIKTR